MRSGGVLRELLRVMRLFAEASITNEAKRAKQNGMKSSVMNICKVKDIQWKEKPIFV